MNFGDRYGLLDRLLYRLAFQSGTAQHALADVEEMLYEDTLEGITVDDPVFISALPRAGTTILLKLLWQTGRFASHTYRDMPFVLCPMLWRRFSRPFVTQDLPSRERAHGDGLRVSRESPEAFEEMIWKRFWPDHYGPDRIRPWQPGEENRAFERFFEAHMRKVVALCQTERKDELCHEMRYLSKNNLNIARLAAPPAPLRRGTVLIPFREPIQQAASMFRQHRRFLNIHEEDDFVRAYMEAIGHHEFGQELQPVNFGGWLEEAPPSTELSFWVQYWTAAYQFVLAHAGNSTVLVSYGRLTEEPESSLSRLARAVDLPPNTLRSQADRLHPPRTHSVAKAELPSSLLREASETFERLDREAVV